MSDFHFAKPGPLYWDFKCLVCDGDVKGHFWRLIRGDVAERRQTQMSEYGDKGESK